MFSTFLRDSRYAIRMLLHNPGFTLIAVMTFALGIGVNAAVFTVFNGVLLRPLPYPDPDRITMIWMDNRRQGIKEDITSYPNYRDWKEQNTSYAHIAGIANAAFNLTGAGEPERLTGAQATASFFDVMGLKPVIGRVFTEANETPGQDRVVVISHGLWMRRFGGSADALGKTMTLNGNPHEIIGVMPGALRVPEKAEVWRPLALPEQARTSRGSFFLPVIGRLKPGVSVQQAQTDMSGISARLEQAYEVQKGFGAYVVSLHRQLVGDIERSLLVLMAAVGFVLLIACANLGNLMLGKTATRQKELAVRSALGAKRARLIVQIVTETLLLAAAGGVLGVLFAYWASQFFITIGGDSIPRPDAIGIDFRVLGFALLLAVVAAVIAGLVPALQASRSDVVEHLREGGREGGSVASRRTRSVLVAAEVALAFVLLAGAGLLMRTLWSMERVDRGFRPESVAMTTISAPAALFAQPVDVRGFYARALERVRALPGVESAGTATGVLLPLLANSTTFSIEGKPLPREEERIEYPVESVSPGYFETLGYAVASGRTFNEHDHADAPRAVVINETLARQGWPGQDAVGRRLRPGDDTSTGPWLTVVGVVRDVRRGDLRGNVRPEVYLCSLQATPRTQMLLVRTSTEPAAILPSVRAALREIHPQIPLFNAGTLAGEFSETLTSPRFRAILLAGFAVIALLLASIGIYGVTAHAVSQRRHEVGIRMALGARGGDVLGLMMAQHLRPALIGLVIGVAAAIALSRSLSSLVYGVGTTDPLTFAAMGIALVAVAAAACWIPARRATRVDPVVALRTQ
jgi:putative ABC transport system permease protein